MLEKFGLSNYENKVYMTLMEIGLSDARTISTQSKVPYGRIYDVLDSLSSQKIIIEQNGRPKQYLAVEPGIVLENLIKSQKQKLDQLSKDSEITLQKLNRLYEAKPKEKLVWKVAIGDDLYDSYIDLIQEARREFLGYVEINEASFQNHEESNLYLRVFEKLATKGVKVKILVGVEDEGILETLIESNPDLINFLGRFELRTTSILTYPFTILDSEKVILKVVNPIMPTEMLAGIYLWQKDLALTLLEKFDSLWNSSKPIKIGITN